MLPEYVRQMMLTGLTGTPDVIERLMAGVHDPTVLDRRPDPARFTIREILAHLASLEEISARRLKSMLSEEMPTLETIDLDRVAIDNDYAHAVPAEQIAIFRKGRAELVELFRAVSGDDWQRSGNHQRAGVLTVENQFAMIVAHDAYHTAQIAQSIRG